MTVFSKVKNKIREGKKGNLLFISDFSQLGTYDSTRKSLQRLTKQKLLIRLSKGLYYYPKKDDILGILYPSSTQIAQALAKRDKSRIIPTGVYALYLLGLSTQIPMNIVYLSDGSARKISIDKQTITFKKTNPKNLFIEHRLSNLIIQALKSLGKENISSQELSKIKKIIINSQELEEVKKNSLLAAIWIQKIILQISNEIENGNMA